METAVVELSPRRQRAVDLCVQGQDLVDELCSVLKGSKFYDLARAQKDDFAALETALMPDVR